MPTSVALSGDAIINRRVSTAEHAAVRAYLDVLRDADVGMTHLEMLLHEFDRPDIYPNHVSGGHWLQAPRIIAEELRALGIEVVSHASNHAMDYGYGGLDSTLTALDSADVTHAGTGENLAAADAPAYRETGNALVGLVSMTTSFAPAHRAGEARRDVPGRPGVNPLQVDYAVDTETLETITELAELKGWWITQRGDRWLLNPPGERRVAPDVYVESDESAVRKAGGLLPRLREADRERNLASVRDAAAQADVVLGHVHYHSWNRTAGTDVPPDHVTGFARELADAGADIVLFQGTHTPLRGIELYEGSAIVYDPGDFFFMVDSINRLPRQYYERYGDRMAVPIAEARPSDAHAARGEIATMGDGEAEEEEEVYFGGQIHNPPGGYFDAAVLGNMIPVCEFDDDFELTSLTVHPGRLRATPQLLKGVPEQVTGAAAASIIDHVDELSRRFDTRVRLDGDVGQVVPA